MQVPATPEKKKLGLLQASAINMIDMVGIGPFVVMSLVVQRMNGPFFLYAWLAGALLSFIDAMIWSELGAAYPRAGGSYNFLREAFGKNSWGLLLSFLFVWQTLIQAPLVVASGSIAFSQYLGYIVPLHGWPAKAVSGGVVVVITILLYRRIDEVGRIGLFLWAGVIITLGLIIAGGIWKGDFLRPLKEVNTGLHVNMLFFVVLGSASVKTIYSYLGYYNICHIGNDIDRPGKNIPRSMFISIAGVALLYLLMNISVMSVVPWQEACHSDFVVSLFAEKIMGHGAGIVVTLLVLWVALASLFAVLLGYSRVPYAAAAEGDFLSVFAKLHPRKQFPHISLLFLATLGFIFSLLFRLSQVIDAILAMRILIQFIGQAIGVVLLRRKNGSAALPFKMPLYPVPVVVAIVMWIAIFVSTGTAFMLAGLVVILAGTFVYLVRAWLFRKWPFEQRLQADLRQ